jgi:hypothetical protein
MMDFGRWMAQQKPAGATKEALRVLPNGDWLGDIDMIAWGWILKSRGGCRCHLSPPCGACTEPLTDDEMREVGFTHEGGAS